MSLQYAVSRLSVGSHHAPRGVTPPLGVNDRGSHSAQGVTHPSDNGTILMRILNNQLLNRSTTIL